jgi:hypothetical protein
VNGQVDFGESSVQHVSMIYFRVGSGRTILGLLIDDASVNHVLESCDPCCELRFYYTGGVVLVGFRDEGG